MRFTMKKTETNSLKNKNKNIISRIYYKIRVVTHSLEKI